ncbi:hypothetical protein AV530_016944 [Patagioenas fasciata monilis]|uniref:Uncharacterized protein n=1 Tax=Patagioenas fasciata monilis TaxID=372326 RepID=A0A1V4J449_PATFA|nr:hypothetical protein AV530_016944 [Patagioenas fasciata monilis]
MFPSPFPPITVEISIITISGQILTAKKSSIQPQKKPFLEFGEISEERGTDIFPASLIRHLQGRKPASFAKAVEEINYIFSRW